MYLIYLKLKLAILEHIGTDPYYTYQTRKKIKEILNGFEG
jgi:hypothetical protein